MRLPLHLLLLLSGWIAGSLANTQEDAVREFFAQDETLGPPTTSTHTNNWAVLVCASRYWFNYRVSTLSLFPSSISHSYLAYGQCLGHVRTTHAIRQVTHAYGAGTEL